jgi:hypothetical protein
MDADEFDRFEKLSKQKASFDTLDKTELNSDGDDEVGEWNDSLLDGLE